MLGTTQPRLTITLQRLIVTATCVVAAISVGVTFAPPSHADTPRFEQGISPSAFGISDQSLFSKEVTVLTNQGISPERAIQALDVQSKVTEVNLLGELQQTMGSAYAGVWFENAVARLYIGVTSRTGRRAAEDVVTRAGLEAVVTFAPVRSTSAELLATQRLWRRKLTSLFDREEAMLGLQPERNAVSITLTSAVPPRRVAAIKREAAASKVAVLVSVIQGARLNIVQEAKECNNFTKENANCNPSLTSGVSIKRRTETTGEGEGESHSNTTLDNFGEGILKNVLVGDAVSGLGIPAETEVTALPSKTSVTISNMATETRKTTFKFSTGGLCTAGPMAIPMANRKQRVMLTAGHCIQGGHGTGSKWFAFNREPTELLIGKAGQFANGGAAGAKKGDYGEIAIEPGPEGKWQSGVANNPVLALTARWKKLEETRYPVKGERLAAVKNTNCHEGQTSGEWCGEVIRINAEYSIGGRTYEGMVEDSKAISEEGDSGGDWLFSNGLNEISMEGIHAAKKAVSCEEVAEGEGAEYFLSSAECLNYKEKRTGERGKWKRILKTFWQPLRKPEPGGALQGPLDILGLELLTTRNEVIPAESTPLPDITTALAGERYPIVIEGEAKQTVEGDITLASSTAQVPAESVRMAATFTELTALGAATVEFKGVHEKGSEGAKCNTAGDAAGVVLVPDAQFDVVYTGLSPSSVLETAGLVLFSKLLFTCGAIETTVEPALVVRARRVTEGGDSTGLEVEAHCSNIANGIQELSAYFNGKLELREKQLLKANIAGTGNANACEEIKPTLLLNVTAGSTAKMFTAAE